MLDGATPGLELAEIAASADPLPRRAEQLLAVLRRYIPFDSGWLALADPQHPRYTTLASADLADGTRAFFESPQQARDIEAVGLHGPAPPLDPSDLPYPVEELPGWAECLIPAGYRGGLSISLVADGGRHVGFLGLPCASQEPPSPEARRLLAQVSALLGRAVDPARSLAATTQLVQHTRAGVVLHADGGIVVLPGLAEHPLLATGSPALAAARAELAAGRIHQSFLWPLGGRHAPDGHARLTVLAPPGDLPIHLTGVVLLSPPGDLGGLTARELEVLGLLVEGCSNWQISRALVITQRTAAAHLEHILAKLTAPSRTLAAVRAERAGLYVPRVHRHD
jgi:DNA-binding CsgD family transcriptional regulator